MSQWNVMKTISLTIYCQWNSVGHFWTLSNSARKVIAL